MIEIYVIEPFNFLVHFGTPSLRKPMTLGTSFTTEPENTNGVEV